MTHQAYQHTLPSITAFDADLCMSNTIKPAMSYQQVSQHGFHTLMYHTKYHSINVQPAYWLAGSAFASSCLMVLPLPLLVESLLVTLVVLAGLLLLLLPVVTAAFLLFLPVRESTAVQAMKAAHITRPNCRFCMGMPVSAGERRE
jgi:hypothetical protein